MENNIREEIKMVEPPENSEFGLYVAGIDPYRIGQNNYSESISVIERMKPLQELENLRMVHRELGMNVKQ
jgi:hypothetical protein